LSDKADGRNEKRNACCHNYIWFVVSNGVSFRVVLLQGSKIRSGIFYIEIGEPSRQFIKEHSLSNRLAAEIYKSGSRQRDFIAVWMWSHLL
jgi:hypothetical protein